MWNLEPGALAQDLRSDAVRGLSPEEAARRLAAEGRNELQSSAGPSALALLLGQFKSLVIWVLAGAALLSAALGETADAAAIGAIVILNALIGFFQEHRSERAAAALRRMAAPNARVVRDGRPYGLPAAQVVRGDLLLLEAGDLVAADARLVSADALRANEAPLTGESQPVDKAAVTLQDPEVPLADRLNMVHLGTSITGGQGRALVVATGMATEVGHIASLLATVPEQRTPLQRRLDQVGRSLLYASLGIVTLVFLLGLLRGEKPMPMLLTAVSLAIAAVPEGLPAVVTVALALGIGRMIRRNVLVRRLQAVETLGSAQVICCDKTGTLTLSQMTVTVLWAGGREIEVTGEGYSPRGVFREARPEGTRQLDASSDPGLRELLTAAVACNEAGLVEEGEEPGITGDPTEAALLVAAAKAGIRRPEIEAALPRRLTLPFDSDRKRMTVVRRTPDGDRAFVKGAPDLLLALAERWLGPDGAVRPLAEEDRRAIARANEGLAARALRVMGIAFRDLPGDSSGPEDAEALERDLVFAGLMAMRDPPRPEAREAVRRSRQAGVRTVMITGDHPVTAAAVARELEILGRDDEVMAGLELQCLDDGDLRERVGRVSVYARVTAEDKLRVVRALKQSGLVVAMTGDGVNDAPAVREAAIGVAMGITGTEVTREASDIVVTDDNFASIVAAVEEGRGIYDNIRKCLQYLLSGNTSEILIVLAAVLIGWPMPLLPLQILWINLVTDGLPALALATDPVEPDVLQRPPRPTEERLADRDFLRVMFATGAVKAGVALLAFYYGLAVRKDLELARTYCFTSLVFAELFRSLGVRSAVRPFWTRGATWNPRLLAVVGGSALLQIGLHHVAPLRRLFDVILIPPAEGFALLALGCVPLLVFELPKALREGRPEGTRRTSAGPRAPA